MKISISLGGNVVVNGLDFSTLSADEHKRIITAGTTPNYVQVPGWIADGRGDDECKLSMRRTKDGREERMQALDFSSMFGATNFGNANNDVYGFAVSLLNVRFPAISRAVDHALLAPTIQAVRGSTGLDRVFFASSGTDATDAAIAIAYRYWSHVHGHTWKGDDVRWADTCVVAAEGNLHGTTLMGRALSANERMRTNIGPLPQNVRHVPFGDLAAMRRVFEEKARQVVAVILEPLQGAGGCNIPPAGYLRSVQELCREFGSTLILDEVKTGFGRTGHDWAFEAEGFKPDILCAGKSASAGLVPVSFVAGRESVMTCVEPGMIGTTWSATPLQCAALLQALQLLSKGDLAQEAQRKGAVLAGQFDELARTYPDFIVRLRGRALFCALEIKPEVTGRTFVNALLEEGLYTKELGRVNAVYVMPSLTISDALIEKGVGAFARAIARLA